MAHHTKLGNYNGSEPSEQGSITLRTLRFGEVMRWINTSESVFERLGYLTSGFPIRTDRHPLSWSNSRRSRSTSSLPVVGNRKSGIRYASQILSFNASRDSCTGSFS